MKHIIITVILFLLLAGALAGAADAACTLTLDPIGYSYDAGGSGSVNPFGYNTWNANITCPSGQAWQFISNNGAGNTWVQFKSAAGDVIYTYYCKASPCSNSDIYNGTVIASGTGTGAVQVVTMYTRTAGSGTTCICITGCTYHSCKANPYPITPGWGANLFKLVADTTYYASPSGTVTLNQSCLIYSTGNVTMSYNGSADVTGSFSFTYTCGQGSNPIQMSLSGGNNAIGELRRASYSGGYLAYRLFNDSGYTQEIGITTGNNITVANYAAKLIYAKIFKADNSVVGRSGAYIDVVVITLTF